MALVLADFHKNTDLAASSSTAEDKVYVAVGNGVDDITLMLRWAILHFGDHKFCILHVHHTSEMISPSPLSQEQRDFDAAILSSKLDEYIHICNQSGIQAEQVYLEMDSIEKGILELISQHKIKKLIMGAAADQNYDTVSSSYFRKMCEPTSRKAIYVKSHAPPLCHIWFICKGNLVCTREANIDRPSSVSTQEIIMSPQSIKNIEDVCRANALENLYTEELRKRKQIEAELEMLRNHHEKALAEAADQKLVITAYEQTIQKLEEMVAAYAELVKSREEERDEAVKLSGELIESAVNLSSEMQSPEFFLTLPSSEILKAASESDQSSQLLCEGELGNIYKAVLYHTDVTLRFLPVEESLTFQREVEILSKFRHPNLGSLIGACQEPMALVYEHLPNGSLEDRLRCKDDTRPLSWQTRIRIAVELCSALIFLHSHGVIHGALRPSCVLLDPNFTCKIIDFRFPHTGEALNSISSIHISEYTDPEFLDTAEVSLGSDVYSFGLMMLELLTGKPGFSVVEEVKCGLDEGKLDSLLDASAGDWSVLLAEQLAHLGLRCCDVDSSARPDLKSDAWKVLEPMRLSSGSALSFRVGEAPSYFVCPILQEVMEDPHVATDGYTYEAEALRQWLDRGNQTSPMTNIQLDDTRLVPNRALRSAIQEWLQHQRQ